MDSLEGLVDFLEGLVDSLDELVDFFEVEDYHFYKQILRMECGSKNLKIK